MQQEVPSQEQEAPRVVPATAPARLRWLKETLEEDLAEINRSRLKAVRRQEGPDPQLILVLSSREAELRRVISLVEELQTGSVVTSKDTDFLRADELPTVFETGELRDL